MAKIPDRKTWDSRTKSFMTYPGIPPIQIEAGQDYLIDYVDMEVPMRLWHTLVRVDTFKNGRRWEIRSVDPRDGIMSAFLYEREILEVNDREVIVGKPWNHAKFNPHHSDRPFYGAECPSYPACSGGCGLGCTHEIEARRNHRNGERRC